MPTKQFGIFPLFEDMRFFTLLLFVLFAVSCPAQSIDKRYRSTITQKGTLHFFRPMKLTKVENMDKFVYDMTYISNTDSVTLNFTIEIKNPQMIEKVELQADGVIATENTPKMLYRDVLSSTYVERISVRLPYKDIEQAFKSETPLSFLTTLSDGTICKATYPKSKWKKENANITRILQSIKLQ